MKSQRTLIFFTIAAAMALKVLGMTRANHDLSVILIGSGK